MWKKVLEVYYFFMRHRYLWLGIIHNNKLDRLEEIISVPNRQTIIVRNQDDDYSGKGLNEKLRFRNLKFVELPGIHDDYYSNPKPYVDLLLKEL